MDFCTNFLELFQKNVCGVEANTLLKSDAKKRKDF